MIPPQSGLKRRIKLVAIDLDGTLLDPKYKINRADYEAVQRARERGVMVVLVTGRRYRLALPYARELKLDSPLIVHNGAVVRDPSKGSLLFYKLLPIEESRRVIAVARRAGVVPVVTIDPAGYGRILVDSEDENNASLAGYLKANSEDLIKVNDLIAELRDEPVQITFSDRPRRIERLSAMLGRELGGRIKQLKTSYPHRDLIILDILNPLASKGAALAFIAEKHGIERQEILAIGDNFNDLEMLEYAGVGVVMSNADERLKSMGFIVTASNEDGGVAQVLERFVF